MTKEAIEKYRLQEYYIAYLDGAKCKNITSFLYHIGKAFSFPAYYGQNMNALNDCLNDLEWIKEENYVLAVINMENFLSAESIETQKSIWDFLEGVRIKWASVPNYEGENNFRHKADFVIIKNLTEQQQSLV